MDNVCYIIATERSTCRRCMVFKSIKLLKIIISQSCFIFGQYKEMIFWVLRIDIGTYRTTWVYNYNYLYAHKKCLEDCFKLESQKISKYYHAPGTPPKKKHYGIKWNLGDKTHVLDCQQNYHCL